MVRIINTFFHTMDSNICKTYVEDKESVADILLQYSGVVNYGVKHLDVSRSLPGFFSKPKMLRFLEELGWHK